MRSAVKDRHASGSAVAPLRYRAFRNIWLGSILSNLGQFVQSVGAAWAMVQIGASAGKVGLVQTAAMLPLLLLSVPAGALADMYDRRMIAMIGLAAAGAAAIALTLFSAAGPLPANVLLLFCFGIGSGVALFSPAWLASVREQVPVEVLPAAIGLNSISFNIARGVGPAIGGLVVALAGASAAFAANAVLYIPLIVAFARWQPPVVATRLPPERLGGAVLAGLRYTRHSPAIYRLLLRSCLSGFVVSPLLALTPLVAHDLLGGGPRAFGLLLGAFGGGAVLGGLNIARLSTRLGAEPVVRYATAGLALAALTIALSRSLPLSMIAMIGGGMGWMLVLGLLNVGIQLAAPRWVTGRIMAMFSALTAGGIAAGSALWGAVAGLPGVGIAGTYLIAAALMVLLVFAGWLLPIPARAAALEMADSRANLATDTALAGSSGPIRIEVEYRIAPDAAADFCRIMQALRRTRLRDGARNWSLRRDIADPQRWVEGFGCLTWHDYLRLRDRRTEAQQRLIDALRALQTAGVAISARRFVDQPGRFAGSADDRGPQA